MSRFRKMNRRERNQARHRYIPQLSWDQSAFFCSDCSQSEGSWRHTPLEKPWYITEAASFWNTTCLIIWLVWREVKHGKH